MGDTMSAFSNTTHFSLFMRAFLDMGAGMLNGFLFEYAFPRGQQEPTQPKERRGGIPIECQV